MAMTPAALPSMATKIAVAPSLRAAARPPASSGCGRDAELGQEPRVAERRRGGARPCRSRPCRSASRSRAPAQARCLRSAAASTMAAASGCSLARSTLAASRSTSLSSKPSRGIDRDHLRLAFGQRAGLVDDQRVDLLHALQRLGVLDQHARLRAAADADHDRHRRGEAERAGAGDDQHRHRRDQAVGEARLRPEHRPGGERQRPRRRSRPARTSRRPGRRAAGSARASAAPSPPSARSAPACVSRPTFSARITKPPLRLMRAADDLGAGVLARPASTRR